MVQLKKVLSLRTIVATGAGLAFCSSTLVAQVQVAGFVAGDSAWMAILISGLLCMLAATCFSELNGQLPSAAGIRLYFSRAFNEKTALTVSLLYMAVITGVIGAESFILGSMLHEVIPGVPPFAWILLMLAAVTFINIRGIKIYGGFQDAITYGMIVSLALMALLAFASKGFHFTAPLVPGSADGLINAVALGIFLFVGFEWVTPLAEEVTDSSLISKGMLYAVGLLSVVYAFFTVAMTSMVPKEILVASPIPHFIFAQSVFGKPGVVWILIISLAATITTFNAGIVSVSRFMYASARENVLPKIFARISMRYFTPWVSILILFGIGVILSAAIFITERYMVLVNMAAAMESIVYTLAGLAVIFLRRKEPDANRPYQIRGGIMVPVFTAVVFGGLAVAVLTTEVRAAFYIGLGFLVSFIYVSTVVPYLKEQAQKARALASKRRRRRRPVEVNEPSR